MCSQYIGIGINRAICSVAVGRLPINCGDKYDRKLTAMICVPGIMLILQHNVFLKMFNDENVE